MTTDGDESVIVHSTGEPSAPENNVVKLTFSPLPITTERTYDCCQHSQSVINEQARTLKCKACQVDLDPITVLAALSRHGERFMSLRREEKLINERISKLEHEERLIKARIRNARKKLGPEPGPDGSR